MTSDCYAGVHEYSEPMGVYVNQKLNNSNPGPSRVNNRASNIYDDVETRDPLYDNNVMIEATKRHSNLHSNQQAARNSHGNQIAARNSHGNQLAARNSHGNQLAARNSHGNQPAVRKNINAINNLSRSSSSGANNIEDLYTKPDRLTPSKNIAGKLSPSKIMAFEKPALLPKPVMHSVPAGAGLVPSAPAMPAGNPAGPAAPAGMPGRSRNKKPSVDDGYDSHSGSNSSLINLQEGENMIIENDLYHYKKSKPNT